jgi:hypothetical protein
MNFTVCRKFANRAEDAAERKEIWASLRFFFYRCGTWHSTLIVECQIVVDEVGLFVLRASVIHNRDLLTVDVDVLA